MGRHRGYRGTPAQILASRTAALKHGRTAKLPIPWSDLPEDKRRMLLASPTLSPDDEKHLRDLVELAVHGDLDAFRQLAAFSLENRVRIQSQIEAALLRDGPVQTRTVVGIDGKKSSFLTAHPLVKAVTEGARGVGFDGDSLAITPKSRAETNQAAAFADALATQRLLMSGLPTDRDRGEIRGYGSAESLIRHEAMLKQERIDDAVTVEAEIADGGK
jgi:hypothetical protein